jgi:tRNA (uracil-5-)-methyltransferase TRM9
MRAETIQKLLELNHQFYRDFATAFAATRRRIQPGVRRILAMLSPGGNWLDLGCGSGMLAMEWIRSGHSGSYTGLDFSAQLLQEAQNNLRNIPASDLQVQFIQADLTHNDWTEHVNRSDRWDGVLAFAVLHHIPSSALRQKILNQVHTLLKPSGWFIHSEWQFHHSPRLLKRILPWQTIGLTPNDVEDGDYLLDWRHILPGQPAKRGLRYVHLFNRQELKVLASESGFQIIEEFESDGEGNKLGLYQVWQSMC